MNVDVKQYSRNCWKRLSDGKGKVWRYQRGKWKKDKQYNGNKGNGQNDKQWSIKYYTENYDPASHSPIQYIDELSS